MIKAPYNFVPLAQTVVFPEWAEKISMDIPFKDGISGTIDVSYTAQTPVFIGNGKEKDEKGNDTPVVKNYKAANGQYALPGSSLRGMLRNVIEIASFGKFCRIDDSILSHRDLHDKKYTNAFRNKNINAGWLVYDDKEDNVDEKKEWALYPVEYHRVEDSLLEEKIYHPEKSYKERCEPQERRKTLNGNPIVYFEIGRTSGSKYSLQSNASFVNQKPFQGSTKGYTVLTGQPGSKKKDFIFEEKTSEKFDSIDEIIRTFQGVNEANPANQKKGYNLIEELRDFQDNNYPGIPVFYLAGANGKPETLGLSQMFRLPYKNTLMEAVLHSSELHGEESRMDLPECIFGKIHNPKNKDGFSLRGRVQFEDAVGKNVSLDSMVTTILGNPKPSFYPNYIEQNPRKGDYTTLMDDDVRLRGWKRYPVRNTPNPLVPENEQKQQQQKFMESSQQENSSDKKQKNQDNLITKFEPLKKNSVFEGKIHFHNLKPEELGALLWAITWNNNKELSHSIGMGKPYGFGQIKAEIKSLSFLENSTISNDYAEANVEQISSWQNKFSIFMESQISNWKDSQQLEELFAMSNPEKAERPNWDLEHMSLSDKEFTKAKGGQNNPKEYLAPYSSARQNLSLPKNGTNNSGSFSQPIRPTNIPAVDPKKLAQELATAPKEGDTVTVIVDKPPKKGVMDTHIESNKNFIVIVRDISGKFNKEWQKQGAKFKIKIFKKDSLNDKKFTALAKDAESL